MSLCRIGQREVDEAAGVRIGRNESAFHAPLSRIKSWCIGHHGVMRLRLSFVERRKARTIVMKEGESEEKGGEIDAELHATSSKVAPKKKSGDGEQSDGERAHEEEGCGQREVGIKQFPHCDSCGEGQQETQ